MTKGDYQKVAQEKAAQIFMLKTIITVLIMMVVGQISSSKSQAQTDRDKRGQAYFERAAAILCGPGVHVRFSTDRAYVYVSGEYLENRNLNEVAHSLALDGLNAFPKSRSFYVEVQDSKARGSAEVRR
jgi:hypothetical protein